VFAAGGGGTGASAEEIWTGVDLESGLTPRDMLRLILAATTGRTTGAGTTTEQFLSRNGLKPRVTTEFDSSGNRAVVNLDAS
jgi:hypothetical protein